MARKNRDIEILVKLASQGNFDAAQKQLEQLKKTQEGAAAGGADAIGKLQGAWKSWTSLAEVSSRTIQRAFLTALGPIGAIIQIVEAVARVFAKLIGFVKDYQRAQKEANDTVNASADALATANRTKEKYADATGIETLNKALKAHEADVQNLAKNYEKISKAVEGAGQQWWNVLSITSQTTQRYQEQLALLSAQKLEAEEQVRAKQAQLEAEKDLEKATKERQKAEEEVADRLAKLTLSETAFKEREVSKQIAAYEKAGVAKVELDKLRAAEMADIEREAEEKRVELDEKIKDRIAQSNAAEAELKRQHLEEELAQYVQHGADLALVDQLRAVETARIEAEVTQKKKMEADKRRAIEKQQLDASITALNNLAVFQNSKNKEMAAIGKASAIAATTIETYAGATKAFSALAPIPLVGPALGAAAAAAAIAAGLARVAIIQGVELEKGGVGLGSRDGTIVKFAEKNRDEAVLPLEDPRAMRMVGEAISQAGGMRGGNMIVLNVNAQVPEWRHIINALSEEARRGGPEIDSLASRLVDRAELNKGRAS